MEFPLSKFTTDTTNGPRVFSKVVNIDGSFNDKLRFYQLINRWGVSKIRLKWDEVNPSTFTEGVKTLSADYHFNEYSFNRLELLYAYSTQVATDFEDCLALEGELEKYSAVYYSLTRRSFYDNVSDSLRVEKDLHFFRTRIFAEDADNFMYFRKPMDLRIFILRLSLGKLNTALPVTAVRGVQR